MIPFFDIEITTMPGHGTNQGRVEIVRMSFLHMSHRFGPVTTARLLAGDIVERFSRDRAKIIDMVLDLDRNREGAL